MIDPAFLWGNLSVCSGTDTNTSFQVRSRRPSFYIQRDFQFVCHHLKGLRFLVSHSLWHTLTLEHSQSCGLQFLLSAIRSGFVSMPCPPDAVRVNLNKGSHTYTHTHTLVAHEPSHRIHRVLVRLRNVAAPPNTIDLNPAAVLKKKNLVKTNPTQWKSLCAFRQKISRCKERKKKKEEKDVLQMPKRSVCFTEFVFF